MANIQSNLVELGLLDTLSRQETAVHRLDPRAKIAATLVFIVCVVSFDKYAISALVPYVLFPVALLACGNIPAGFVLRRILWVSPFAILLGMFNPWLDRQAMMTLGGLSISGGWVSFGSILLKFVLTVSAALLLIATTGFTGVCRGLQRLKVPEIFTLQLLFLYRYLFVLMEEAARLVRARSLRSAGRKGTGVAVFGSMTGHLLLRTLDRAERITLAMHCRGFEGQIHLSNELRFKISDWFFLLVSSGVFVLFRQVNVALWLGQLFSGVSL